MSETPAKLRINKNDGIVEIEGSEDFIMKMMEEYKELFTINIAPKAEVSQKKPKTKELTKKTSAEPTPRRKSGSESVVAIDVDLSEADDYSSLKDFYGEKKPQSFMEKTVVFTYYLEENKGIELVTPGHLITCYRAVGSRIPAKVGQTILDAKKRYGWVTTDSGIKGAKLSNLGRNLVEHDLPRKKDD